MEGTINFSLVHCYLCSTPFYMTTSLNKRRREDGKNFWCPNGHDQHYTESDVQRLEKELKSSNRLKDHYRETAERNRMDRERVERRLTAMKGQVTKANNKLKKGVCPCCDQHFPDLENHIKSQHPDFEIDQSGTKDPEFEAPKAPPRAKRGRPRKVTSKV